MTVSQVISWGCSKLGQTFQEAKDIYANGCALWHHSDLQNRKVKILSLREVCDLRILIATNRSRLFIFRDYCFEHNSAKGTIRQHETQLLPVKTDPSSLVATFWKESLLRTAKAVAVVALVILASPLWAPVALGVLCYDYQTTTQAIRSGWNKGSTYAFEMNCYGPTIKQVEPAIIPAEPADSHVTALDICRIGRALVGYRHVSSEEAAQENATKGFSGCSLNISFCPSVHEIIGEKALFENLDLKLKAGENCANLIAQYEKAITDFISSSIMMDRYYKPQLTYKELFDTLDQTRFMIVKTSFYDASDTSSYGHLGRFPQEYVAPKGVFLLPRLQRQELKISQTQSDKLFSSEEEYRTLVTYIASHYRQKLLCYIRQDFHPEQFQSLAAFDYRRTGSM